MSDAITLTGVSKSYGPVKAVDNVSLTVGTNELFGLIGPDGAGKTTLYHILATLSRPDSGSATVLGMDTTKDYRRLRTRIGYMPDRFALFPDLTVMENLRFFASIFGVTVDEHYDLIAPVFGQLGKFPNRRAGALSGGMKQKLALSCALIHRPELLLLDEPTTGVDAVSRSEFWDMLDGLRHSGITIMVSTSYMDEATRCQRVAIMDSGHILRADTPQGLIESLDERLYNAEAPDMFRLLGALRSLNSVEACYTFGSTLHVVAGSDFEPTEAEAELRGLGVHDARIYPAKGDIEDLFIKLTSR